MQTVAANPNSASTARISPAASGLILGLIIIVLPSGTLGEVV